MTPSNRTAAAAAKTVEKVVRSVNVFLEKNSYIDDITRSAAKTGQKLVSSYAPAVLDYLPQRKVGKEFVFVLAVLLVIAVFFWLGAARTIVDMTGLVYPAYASVLAIESRDKADGTQWLTYWFIYMGLRLTDPLTWPVLRVIPLYPVLKALFMAWLYHPDFCGATTCYQKAQPYLLHLLQRMDPAFNTGAKSALGNRSSGSSVNAEKNNNNTAAASGEASRSGTNSSASAASAGGAAKGDENAANLVVMVGTVRLSDKDTSKEPKERNLYVEATVLPCPGRPREGIEGVACKTNKMMGSTYCAFNQTITFVPLTALDGTLKLDILDKPTFAEVESIGTAKVSLLDLIPGGGKVSKTIQVSEQASLSLDLQLAMGPVQEEATDVYEGARNPSGQPHGYGHLTSASGDYYKGHFFKGKRHGNGVLVYAGTGEKYIGEWRDDLRHGQGEMRDGSNVLLAGMSGQWVDGHMHS